jgi:hypothetical protein
VAAVTHLGVSRVASHLSRGCSTSEEQLKCCSYGGNLTANKRGCGNWNEFKAALLRLAPAVPLVESGTPSGGAHCAPGCPQPSPEQMSLGDT